MKLVRSLFLLPAAILMSLPANLAAQGGAKPAEQGEFIVYIGTFTSTTQKSKGIYSCRFQPATGTLTPADLVAETANPTFLALDPSRRNLSRTLRHQPAYFIELSFLNLTGRIQTSVAG